VARLFVRMI